ncbi:MAG: dihydrodipicolinate synthase family protein [Proteobacteria bacterium]|nr:MAG: dihydrodipicolinate synthase family protein [Pseudomonadota bacterium]
MRPTTLTDTWARASLRRPHGIAAALLPYRADDAIDWAAFEAHVARTREAGLDVAVNMDTGFGDLLAPAEREAVLDAARRALPPGSGFYAGAYALGAADPGAAYREAIAAIERRGGTPVIVQCPRMKLLPAPQKAALYAEVAAATANGALAFELSPRFAPHGEIWDDETFARLLEIPELHGAKHSSLDRATELRRLAARDRARPSWSVYTGNDLAIDLVVYGSDYLLGLATFAPERFAARDAALGSGDVGFLARNDDLQHLGNVGFREPIPAYKHAAAQFLHLTGGLPSDSVHPKAPRRPGSDRVLLYDCARRLGMLDDPESAWRERVEPYL